MTKLQQTIKVRVHTISGLPIEYLPIDIRNGRASGRTTAIILHGLSEAMRVSNFNSSGNCVIYDHHGKDRALAAYLLEQALSFVSKANLNGFSFELSQSSEVRHLGYSVWGVRVTFNQTMDAYYDLRK